jgi:transcriptional regulator with XRE-family HTH domain
LPYLCLLRFGSTNNYHRTGTKSTDFFERSEYFLGLAQHAENPYSLFTAAQFLCCLVSIFILDFFAACFIMALCKLNAVWICKIIQRATNTCVKATGFWFTKIAVSHKIRREKNMTLGEKLTQARKAAGLTQADVAAKLNVSRQAVSRWESGQSKPSTERLLALGELYGVSIDQLLNTENVEMPAVETVSAPPEMEPREPVIPEKRRTRVWLKYAVAVLCGVIVTLFVVWLFSKSGPIGKLRPKSIEDLKTKDISDISSESESYFDFTWD